MKNFKINILEQYWVDKKPAFRTIRYDRLPYFDRLEFDPFYKIKFMDKNILIAVGK